MEKKIRIAIADDHKLVRAGLVLMLEPFTDMEVVMEAVNGIDLFQQIGFAKPDVILLDLKMKRLDGFETIRWLNEYYPEIKIIVLTFYESHHIAAKVMKDGAHGFLLKGDTGVQELINAIYSVVNKGHVFNDHVSSAMLAELTRNHLTLSTSAVPDWDDTNTMIIVYTCMDLTIDEIADKVHLSAPTVKVRLAKIYEDADVTGKAGLALYAKKHKII